jgi:D-amino-acid dehydrogenase
LLRSQAELNAARASLEMKRLAGLVQAMLSYQEACFLEPALEQAREIFLGALYAPGDETGNCAEFARNLIALCEEQFGVEFHTLSRVIGKRIWSSWPMAMQSINSLNHLGTACRSNP